MPRRYCAPGNARAPVDGYPAVRNRGLYDARSTIPWIGEGWKTAFIFPKLSPTGRIAVEAFCATTAGNFGISAGNLKTVPVPVPPLADQRRIVAYLEDLQAKVDALKTLQEETEKELNALMPSILSRAFSGEL